MQPLLWNTLREVLAETESSISPGNAEIHWGILLIYLTIFVSFPENKPHSMEIIGVLFLSHNNPLRMQGRKLKGAGPQWNPWATVTDLACLPLDFWLYRMNNCPVIHGSTFLLLATKRNLGQLRVKRHIWILSQNLFDSNTCSLNPYFTL